MRFGLSVLSCLLVTGIAANGGLTTEPDARNTADLIVHNGKVITLDDRLRVVEALAVKDGRILAVGDDVGVLRHKGAKTRLIDAGGHSVLPGLYDSHTHPLGAATSELAAPLPTLNSLEDVFAHIKQKTATTPEGHWIVLRYAFPTRLKEARFPTMAELDAVAPRHPVLYHAGPAGVVNSMGLKLSGITRGTPNPTAGRVVKDPITGEPTGMLRNAYGVLKGVPRENDQFTAAAKRAAVKKLFQRYNAQGLTSIADRNADRDALDLYLTLRESKELTLRINVSRSFSSGGTREEIARRLDALPGEDRRGGPTGVGDDWVRIGPIKLFLDGGMLNGSAYMRQPWPKGPTYQITEDDYRGLLFIQPEQLHMIVDEAVRRGWQITAHTAGEGAMDVLLDAYELVHRQMPINDRRLLITHANFPSEHNLERCRQLGVCADVQPAWLWKDGATLADVLGADRIRWFQPYKTWLQHTTIGGGSDHMLKLDSVESTNPWNPWLGMQIAMTRKTERGPVLVPSECLSHVEALRLYTINNAYLHHEEKDKGTLVAGKLADLVIIDRDFLACPLEDIAHTQVVYTIVGGEIVYERRR